MAPRLLALGLAGTLAAGTLALSSASSAAVPVRLESGTTPATTVFPNDAFTVADAAQVTGRRVALPTAGCDALGRSLCDDLRLINQLDGFDLQPRVVLPFDGDVDLLSITPDTVYIEGPGGVRGGLVQLVLDPATDTVTGRTDAVLRPSTAYTLVVTDGVKAADGTPVVVGTGTARRVPFTTMSATNTLDKLRAALDDGSAYEAAGIPEEQRSVAFDAVPGLARSVFSARTVRSLDRQDQTFVDPAQPKTASQVLDPIRAASGFYGFGSIRSPQYTRPDGVIAPFPSTTTPRPLRAAQIGVTMAASTPGSSCLQPVVYGPGFSRSKYDLFLSGDTFPARNVALFATDPLGHSFGPESTFTVTQFPSTVVTGSGFGRAVDVDGDGRFSNTEGVGPSYSVKKDANGQPVRTEEAGRDYSNNTTPDQASPDAAVLLRDGLIQTVVDNMALVRALEKGVDVDGNGTVDTCVGPGQVTYFGQSFGGIYGTMLLGTDPNVKVGVPNVPGANVTDIARTSGFRLSAARNLEANEPDLRNGGPGLNGFTESLPLRLDPRNDRPLPGSLPIQELLARADWVSRSGDPSAFAHRLGKGGMFESKKLLVQVAYADGTVPNPTSGTLLRAGDLYERAWVYRNDRTATFQTNPHGFLLDPRLAGREQGQEQIQRFLVSKGTDELDPDGPGPVWEKNPTLYKVQLECLHYPDPQTGMPQSRTPNAADCPDRSRTLASAVGATPTPTASGTTSPTPSASGTASPGATPSTSATACPTSTGSASPAASASASAGPTSSASASASPTSSASASPTSSASASPRPGLPLPLPGSGGSASPSATSSPTACPASGPTVAVTPGTITARQSARVTGSAEPGATVELFAYSRPSTTYRKVRETTADAQGRFAFSVAPSGNTRLYVRSGERDSGSRVLQVRTSINLRVVRTGERTYRFSGSTLPKRRGQLVQVVYARPGGRTLAAKARVASDGTYLVTRTFSGTGTFTFTTITGTDHDNAAGTSNAVRTTVR